MHIVIATLVDVDSPKMGVTNFIAADEGMVLMKAKRYFHESGWFDHDVRTLLMKVTTLDDLSNWVDEYCGMFALFIEKQEI